MQAMNRVTHNQSGTHPSYWQVVVTPPFAHMKRTVETHFMDDYGTLVKLDFEALSLFLRGR